MSRHAHKNANTQPATLLWHDYETTGIDPARDRILQFAAIRTDEELNIVGDEIVYFAKLANDILPSPDACLVTGLTPQECNQKGVNEAEFSHQLSEQFSQPNSCGVGYNSLRFDDEFTRNTFYRNFYDPYAREWQQGNSRWDIIDMVRMCYALRPDGINWVYNDEGIPSFKLELLSKANGIEHIQAHDALSDVHATIALARLIKQQQPKLYEFAYNMRFKANVLAQFDIASMKPLLHTSNMFPNKIGCTSLIVPIARHPENQNAIICYDLRHDPGTLLSASADQLQQWLFMPKSERSDETPQIALKLVHINRSPMLAPVNTLTDEAAARIELDMEQCKKHQQQLLNVAGLSEKVQRIYESRPHKEASDPDLMIYSGGFFSPADKGRFNTIHQSSADELANAHFAFKDKRLGEMLFRYRARNYPHSLNADEHAQWEEFRQHKLLSGDDSTTLTLSQYQQRIAALRDELSTELGAEPSSGSQTGSKLENQKLSILDALEQYPAQIGLSTDK